MLPKKVKYTSNVEIMKQLMEQAQELHNFSASTRTIELSHILDGLVRLTARRGFDGLEKEKEK